MSRWDGVLPKLPPSLRNRRLLDAVAAMDEHMRLEKGYGGYTIEAHYAAGAPKEAKFTAPHQTFGPPDE